MNTGVIIFSFENRKLCEYIERANCFALYSVRLPSPLHLLARMLQFYWPYAIFFRPFYFLTSFVSLLHCFIPHIFLAEINFHNYIITEVTAHRIRTSIFLCRIMLFHLELLLILFKLSK